MRALEIQRSSLPMEFIGLLPISIDKDECLNDSCSGIFHFSEDNSKTDRILQLGWLKSQNQKREEYHCNTFMVDFKKNKDYDIHYRNLKYHYKITRIERESKLTKDREDIYITMDQ